MRFRVVKFATLTLGVTLLTAASARAQLGARPADEWVKTLDGVQRVEAMKIDNVVAALKLKPGQTVADIGAGSGLFEVTLARAVGSAGRVLAEDIDAGFFPEITRRVTDAKITNVQTVLGMFTDPMLPTRSVDLALFHDVLHHIEHRPEFIKTTGTYIAPSGRIAVVDYLPAQSPHPTDPQLQVSRQEVVGWMRDAGFTHVEDVKMFPDRFFVIFSRQ